MRKNTLDKWLKYDPVTGIFTWVRSPSRAVSAGDAAGHVDKRGYVTIGFSGKVFKAHRLAFLAMGQKIPRCVDHCDRNKCNNVWTNLRPATHTENARNALKKRVSVSGVRGVYPLPSGKFYASIQVNKKPKYLGVFPSISVARAAYLAAVKAYFKQFGVTDVN